MSVEELTPEPPRSDTCHVAEMRKGRDSREARSNNEAIASEKIKIVFANLRRLRRDKYQSVWRVWEFKRITYALDDLIVGRNRFTCVQKNMFGID